MCVSGVDINIDIWGMIEQILTQYTWSYGFWWAVTMNLLGFLSWFIFLVSSFNLMRIETIKWGINISIFKERLMLNVSSDVYGVCPQYSFNIGKIRVFR